MENELLEIKASMEASPNSHSPHSNTVPSVASLECQNEAPDPADTCPSITLHSPASIFTTQTIDEIEIQPSDIAELLQLSAKCPFGATTQRANTLKILYPLSSALSNSGRY